LTDIFSPHMTSGGSYRLSSSRLVFTSSQHIWDKMNVMITANTRSTPSEWNAA